MSIQSEPNNSQQSVPAANWLAEGDAHYQERRYKDALNCYTQLVIAEPQNAVAWQKKAQAMVMSLKYAEAVETCAIALKLDPQNASIWFLKSFAHSMLGQYEEAVDSSTEGLKLEPGNNMVWSARGQYLYALGRLEEALESFGTALKMAPDNPYFQEVTGKIKKWLQRDGQSPEWASQVMDFLQQGGYQDALNAYQESMKIDPRAVTKAFNKDYALAHITNPEQLMKDYEKSKSYDQPRIFVELSQKEFEFSREAWVEVSLNNHGKTAARDVTFSFSQDVSIKQLDVTPEQLEQLKSGGSNFDLDTIPEILPGNKVKKLVSLTPARLGQLALEVRINYTDIWNVPQSKTAVTWITVFKPGGQMPSIPGYKLLWRLSASDAAVIYVGQKISDNLRLIIKTPQFSLEQNSLISEYMSELKQASRLVHPNIITIQAFGEQPVPWVALEYMSKGTLARRIGQISIEEALRIAISITDALYYGRMNRLAHRWVTPDNIFFNEQDVPKLANWRVGQITQKLYKNAGSAELMTAYYPPEKLLNSGGLDFFSDIYQLAAVLYEMLTGKPVFTEKGDELVDKIRHGHPHAASYYNPEINKPLDDLLQSCLAKNKKDRPQSTNGLKIELQKILSAYKKQPQKK